MENFIIKANSIFICVLLGIILYSLWIVLFPIRTIADLIIFAIERLTGEEAYHNYTANSFIRYKSFILKSYEKMMDKLNFE